MSFLVVPSPSLSGRILKLLGIWPSTSPINVDIAVGHDIVEDGRGNKAQKPRHVEILVTVRGGELLSDALSEYTTHHNIHRIHTGDGQHTSSGVAERRNKTAEDKARTAYLASNLPPSIRSYAFLFTCCAINLVPLSGILTDESNAFMHRKLNERAEAAAAEAAAVAEPVAAAVQSGDDILERPVADSETA